MIKYLNSELPINSKLRHKIPDLRDANQLSPHVPYKVPVKKKGIFGKGFRQEIEFGVLVLGLYVRDFKHSVLDMFSQEVVARRVDRYLNRTVVVPKNLDVRTPKIWREETPH